MAGATIAASQGVIALAHAGLVDVPYDPVLLLGALGLTLLLAFTVTTFGVLAAVMLKQAQTFTWVIQMVVFPMFFLGSRVGTPLSPECGVSTVAFEDLEPAAAIGHQVPPNPSGHRPSRLWS